MRSLQPSHRIFLILSLSLIVGCANRASRLSDLPGRDVAEREQAEVLRRLKASGEEIRTFRGLYDVTIDESAGRGRLREAIVFARPDRLRLESFPENSFVTINLTVADDTGALFLDPGEKTAYVARAGAGVLQRMYKLPLEAADLMSLVTGRIPSHEISNEHSTVAPSEEVPLVRLDEEEHEFVLRRKDDSAQWRVDSEHFMLKSAEYADAEGQVIFRVSTAGSREVDALAIPAQVLLQMPLERTSIELNFQSSKINIAVPDRLFKSDIPADYKVVNLEQ